MAELLIYLSTAYFVCISAIFYPVKGTSFYCSLLNVTWMIWSCLVALMSYGRNTKRFQLYWPFFVWTVSLFLTSSLIFLIYTKNLVLDCNCIHCLDCLLLYFYPIRLSHWQCNYGFDADLHGSLLFCPCICFDLLWSDCCSSSSLSDWRWAVEDIFSNSSCWSLIGYDLLNCLLIIFKWYSQLRDISFLYVSSRIKQIECQFVYA